MVAVVVGMLFCVGLAVAVMALVAVPARREGRDVLTERGEDVLGSIRDSRLTPGRATGARRAESGTTRPATPPTAPAAPRSSAPAPDRARRGRSRDPVTGACGSMGRRPSRPTGARVNSGIDHTGVDPDVRPQDDLFAHINGRWVATTTIPADRGRYGSFDALREAAEEHVRGIIEEVAAGSPAPGTVARQGR